MSVSKFVLCMLVCVILEGGSAGKETELGREFRTILLPFVVRW